MSHNIIEVNGISPNVNGELNLAYTTEYMVFGRGESVNYSESPATGVSSSDRFYFYDSTPVNNITGASFNTANGNFLVSVELPEGEYIMQWSFHLESTSSSWLSYLDVYDNTPALKGRCIIGSLSNAQQSNGWGMAYLNVPSSGAIYKFYLNGPTNIDTIANQGATPSEYSAIYIWKVG